MGRAKGNNCESASEGSERSFKCTPLLYVLSVVLCVLSVL